MSRWITVTPSIGLPGLHEADLSTVLNPRQSWITVESVIGSCEDGGRGWGYTDLEMDNCPGFISDGFDEVRWVNLAYRRMVDPNPGGGSPPPQVSVWLYVKVEKIDFEYRPAFSCRVRLEYDLSEKKKKKQMTVPCDVWKMDSGGYAWRLDVKAALSLGRLN
ncbi:uncharacterized protein LOC143597410 [Bidens hawaiensis]|uniref:uncharacterized protein LOC143597410 n=1 Tax=Bidens hawaiensis TaxID=980011 RepID=UPI00404AF163